MGVWGLLLIAIAFGKVENLRQDKHDTPETSFLEEQQSNGHVPDARLRPMIATQKDFEGNVASEMNSVQSRAQEKAMKGITKMEKALQDIKDARKRSTITSRDDEGKSVQMLLPLVIATLPTRYEDVEKYVYDRVGEQQQYALEKKEDSEAKHSSMYQYVGSQLDMQKQKAKDRIDPMLEGIEDYKDTARAAMTAMQEEFSPKTTETGEAMIDGISEMSTALRESVRKSSVDWNMRTKDIEDARLNLQDFTGDEESLQEDLEGVNEKAMIMLEKGEKKGLRSAKREIKGRTKTNKGHTKGTKKLLSRLRKRAMGQTNKRNSANEMLFEEAEENAESVLEEAETQFNTEEKKWSEDGSKMSVKTEQAASMAEAQAEKRAGLVVQASEILGGVRQKAKDMDAKTDSALTNSEKSWRMELGDLRSNLGDEGREVAAAVDEAQTDAVDEYKGSTNTLIDTGKAALYDESKRGNDIYSDLNKMVDSIKGDQVSASDGVKTASKGYDNFQTDIYATGDKLETTQDTRNKDIESKIDGALGDIPNRMHEQEIRNQEDMATVRDQASEQGTAMKTKFDKTIEVNSRKANRGLGKAELGFKSDLKHKDSDMIDLEVRTGSLTRQLDGILGQEVPEFRDFIDEKSTEVNTRARQMKKDLYTATGDLTEETRNRIGKVLAGTNKEMRAFAKAAQNKALKANDEIDEHRTAMADEADMVEHKIDTQKQILLQTSAGAAERSNTLLGKWKTSSDLATGQVTQLDKEAGRFGERVERDTKTLGQEVTLAANTKTAQVQVAFNPQMATLATEQIEKVEKIMNELMKLEKATDDETEDSVHDMQKTEKGAERKLDTFDNRANSVEKDFKSAATTSSQTANALFSSLAADKQHLTNSAIADASTREKQLELLNDRAAYIQNELESEAEGADSTLKASMAKMHAQSNAIMKSIVKDQSLTEEQVKEALVAEEKRLKQQLSSVTQDVGQAKNIMDAAAKNSKKEESALATSMTDATGSVEGTETTEKATEMKGQEEGTKHMRTATSAAEVMMRAFGKVETAINGAVNDADERWAQQKDATRTRTSALERGARGLAEASMDRIKMVQERGDTLNEKLKNDTRSQDEVWSKSRTEVGTQMAMVISGLADEKKLLAEQRGALQSHVEQGVQVVADETGTVVNNVIAGADNATQAFRDHDNMHKQLEADLEKVASFSSGHDGKEVDELESEINELNQGNMKMHHWRHGFHGEVDAYERAVNSKMKDLGVHIRKTEMEYEDQIRDSDGNIVDAGKEVEIDLANKIAKDHAKLDDEVNRLYAEQDRRLAELMADDTLSEEERQKLMAEIKAETESKVSQIYTEQAQLMHNQANMDIALDNYKEVVNAAEEDTKQALASGNLSPEAMRIHRKMQESASALSKIAESKWVTGSLAQTGSSDESLTQENAELSSANKLLSSQADKLEKIVAQQRAKHATNVQNM